MSDFGFARRCAMINLSVGNQPSPYPAAQRDVKNRIETDAYPVQCLSQGRHVCVIIHFDRPSRKFFQPASEIKIRPAFNLVRTANLSGLPIHWPAEPDP